MQETKKPAKRRLFRLLSYRASVSSWRISSSLPCGRPSSRGSSSSSRPSSLQPFVPLHDGVELSASPPVELPMQRSVRVGTHGHSCNADYMRGAFVTTREYMSNRKFAQQLFIRANKSRGACSETDSINRRHPCACHRDTEPQRTADVLFELHASTDRSAICFCCCSCCCCLKSK